jgi:2,4'-dihydroxyacetophenone dioxygenase
LQQEKPVKMTIPATHFKPANPPPGLQPYSKPQPWGMAPDMMLADVDTADEKLWAPVGPDTWSRPIHLNVTGGFYVHLLRVRRSGVLQRHRHSGQVHALVMKGSWYYLEHDWIAKENSYVFEPPGETHTLVVPDDCEEMVTLFTVHGALMYVDVDGKSTGYDDVFTRIEKYREHFEKVGLGSDHVKQFIR